jgi:aspartyl-tRNA(Asn)/glutamyl-tRNA(Gln) amidotransferase subunit B
MGEISRRLNASETDFRDCPVVPDQLAQLITRIHDDTISNNAARQVMDVLWSSPQETVDGVIEAKGLKQMNDSGALEAIVDTVLAANPKNVAEYRAGNSKALNALVGQIMKGSQGKANPQQVNDLLRQKLA